MQYILGRRLITNKFIHCIVVLREFDIEFATPKSKKSISLTKFITAFPFVTFEPLVIDTLPHEHLFLITTEDP